MIIEIKRTCVSNNLMEKRASLNNEEEDELQSPIKRRRKAVSKKRNVKKAKKIKGIEKNESKKNVSDKKPRTESLRRSVRIRSRGICAGRILRSTSVQRGFSKQNLRMKKPATQKKLEKPSTSHRNAQRRGKNIKPITEKATTSRGSNKAQKHKTVALQAEEEYIEENDLVEENERENDEGNEEEEESANERLLRQFDYRREMNMNLRSSLVIEWDKGCLGRMKRFCVLADSSSTSDSGVTEDW